MDITKNMLISQIFSVARDLHKKSTIEKDSDIEEIADSFGGYLWAEDLVIRLATAIERRRERDKASSN